MSNNIRHPRQTTLFRVGVDVEDVQTGHMVAGATSVPKALAWNLWFETPLFV